MNDYDCQVLRQTPKLGDRDELKVREIHGHVSPTDFVDSCLAIYTGGAEPDAQVCRRLL